MPNGISLPGMSKIRSTYKNSSSNFAMPRHRSGRITGLKGRPLSTPLRAQDRGGYDGILYLAIETDDAGVLDAICAILPQGSRLHVGLAGDMPVRPVDKQVDDRACTLLPELTGRQRDILGLLAQGLSNKEIGRRLALSHFTVRNHISQVMRLLDASTRKEVIARMAGPMRAALPAAPLAAG